MLFSKLSATVANPGDAIVHPADVEQVDYEVELGIVIGRLRTFLATRQAST